MQNLAEVTPVKLLQKHRPNRTHIEALLYGQSGLLERRYTDAYPKQLQQEYRFYKEKYKLQSMPPQLWNFFRLRPNSFPSLRISYLADFVLKSEPIFEQLFAFKDISSLRPFFKLNLSAYWTTHYVFDKNKKRINNMLGKSTINILLINAVLPFCFFYSRQQSDDETLMSVVDAFREIKYEDNKVVHYFKDSKVEVSTALKSQALFHLHQR